MRMDYKVCSLGFKLNVNFYVRTYIIYAEIANLSAMTRYM